MKNFIILLIFTSVQLKVIEYQLVANA